MRDLGRIVRLQIQRASLKTGEKPTRVYDPTPLLAVDRLALGPDGALGEGTDGSWLVDVHHRAHPRTPQDRKSTRLNSSHGSISYAVFCLKKQKCEEQNAEISERRQKI